MAALGVLVLYCHSTAPEPTHWRTPGKTLWTTPAMAAGVTKRLWEVGDGGRARSVGGGNFIKNLRRRWRQWQSLRALKATNASACRSVICSATSLRPEATLEPHRIPRISLNQQLRSPLSNGCRLELGLDLRP